MTVISNLLGGLGDSTISFGLKAIGIDKKERNKFTSGKPSVINAIPVVYGRPGWVVASPVIVGYKVDNWQQVDETVDHNRLCVHHILGEGLMRTPEAFKIEGRLAAYSKKYTQEQAKVIGGEPAPYYLNSYTSYFANGWPTGQYVNERLDSTRDQYSDARWAYSFNSLAGFISYHNTKLTADKYVNAIPRAEFLPNGIVLHDPRIPFDYDNSFVYFVPQDGSPIRSDAEIREALPKSEIGGVGRGWYAENILSETYGSNPSHMDQGYEVYGYSFNNNANSNIGDSPDNNPALVFLDYMVSDIYGASIPVSDNSLNHIIAAANYCDELAPTYAGGPTQQQLSCNIVISTEDDLRDGLEKILKTCRGLMGWVDGQYQLHIPRAGIPIAGDLGSDVIIKRRSLSLGQKSKRLNRVIATYIEPNKGYEENQLVFPPVDSAEDLQWRQTEDKGELNEAEIKLEGCTNAYQAADLCAVIIRESRASITAEYELNLTGLKYTLGDVVRITDPDGAFSNKLFYLRKWQFDFERRVVIIGVREYSDSLYDVLAHPVLERPSGTIIGVDPMIIPNVTGLAFAPAIYNKAILGKLSWTAVNHSSVIRYDVRVIGPTGSVSWASLIDASLTSIEVPYLPSGEYSLEVRARSNVAVGDYTATSVIHNVPSPIAISGLQLIGGSWVGRDAGLKWISNESEAFKRYKVEIRSAAQVVLYSEYSATPRFDLTYDKNITAGLNRAQTIAVATQYEDGSVSIFSELTITNPMPAAPTSIATAVLPNNLDISFDVVNPESDFVGASIEVHKVGDDWARIDLDENVRLYSFSDLDSNSHYEFRLVSRDAFGDGIYSSIIAINTPVPISPAAFDVDAGVNVVTLNITAQVGYVGCVVWVRNRNSVPGTALPSWSGADSSASVSQLASGTDYSVYYAAVDKKGVRGAIVHIPFTTVKLSPVDLSGLSPWATKLDAIDTDWISDKLKVDSIESSKIANLTAAKLTAGIINATIGIQSGGSIESSNNGYKTGLGIYEDTEGTIYTLMTANGSGDIKAGITADGVLFAKGADIEGKVVASSGEISGDLVFTGDNSSISSGKVSLADTTPGIWLGNISSGGAFHLGNDTDYLKYDSVGGLVLGGVLKIRQGDTGPQGDQGTKGNTGNAGSNGATGSQGSRGSQGDQGTKGNTGNVGSNGATGSQGSRGPQGNTGPVGSNGSDASVTKQAVETVIDGGIITTGTIKLDGSAGAIMAGKTGFATNGDGFWLGQSGTHGGAFILGDNNNYLYFRKDTGLRLKAPGLTIDANGADFEGSLNAGAGKCIIPRENYGFYDGIVMVRDTTTSAAGFYVNTTQGVGFRGISDTGYGAYVSSNKNNGLVASSNNKSPIYAIGGGTRTQGHGVIELYSNGCAHIKMDGQQLQAAYTASSSRGAEQRLPYGSAGDMTALYNRDNNRAYLMFCFKSTSDGKGKWQYIDGSSTFYGGSFFT
jgi:hypothetical protein